MDMITSNQGQRVKSRWTHSLKSANSIIERNKQRRVYGESKVVNVSYSVGKERKTGVVTCKGYYGRRNLTMQ